MQHLVTLAEALRFLDVVAAIEGVERMQVELDVTYEEPRPRIGRSVLLVIPDDVADILAQSTFDALAELLGTSDVARSSQRRRATA